METIQASVRIDAPPSVVWDVLIAGGEYAQWNPFITRVSGSFESGARPRLRIAPRGKRAMTFRPRVVAADPPSLLRWVGRLGLPGLCDAEHEFRLSPVDAAGTELVQRETFRGRLVPLLGGGLEATRLGFEGMNEALRQRVEGVETSR